jgi:hypothetical protein
MLKVAGFALAAVLSLQSSSLTEARGTHQEEIPREIQEIAEALLSDQGSFMDPFPKLHAASSQWFVNGGPGVHFGIYYGKWTARVLMWGLTKQSALKRQEIFFEEINDEKLRRRFKRDGAAYVNHVNGANLRSFIIHNQKHGGGKESHTIWVGYKNLTIELTIGPYMPDISIEESSELKQYAEHMRVVVCKNITSKYDYFASKKDIFMVEKFK